MWAALAPVFSALAAPFAAALKSLGAFIAAYRSGRNRQAAVDARAEEKATQAATEVAESKESQIEDNMDKAAAAAPKTRQEAIDRAEAGTL